jgi:hypothetical protein
MWCGLVGNFLVIANLFTLDSIRILSYQYRFLVHPISKSRDGICSIRSSLGQSILRHFALDELTIDPLAGISPLDYRQRNFKCACNKRLGSSITVSCHRFGPSILRYISGVSRLFHIGEPWSKHCSGYGEFPARFPSLT